MKDKHKIVFLFLLVFLAAFSIYVLRPQLGDDSMLYLQSMRVLKTGVLPAGFVPMMLVSTYLGLRLIMALSFLTGSVSVSWLLLNSALYVAMGLFFHSLLQRIMESKAAAFLSALLLVTNYAAVSFGLGYLMDMGGWAFYAAAIYFSYRYLESEGGDKWLYVSAALVGAGGLYKEYSFVAYAVLFGVLVFKNLKNWPAIFKRTFLTGLLAFGPFVLLNIYGFFAFHYTYLDWFLYNQGAYDFQNRPVEFIKSFGSIYNFGWLLFAPGFYILLKRSKAIWSDKKTLFIWLVILSSSAVLLWPVVTRVLFIAMPAAVLVSGLFLDRLGRRWYAALPVFVLYFLASYLMDAYILEFVDLGAWFSYFV